MRRDEKSTWASFVMKLWNVTLKFFKNFSKVENKINISFINVSNLESIKRAGWSLTVLISFSRRPLYKDSLGGKYLNLKAKFYSLTNHMSNFKVDLTGNWLTTQPP